MCIKVGWWNNSILWCTVKKTSNYVNKRLETLRFEFFTHAYYDLPGCYVVQFGILKAKFLNTPSFWNKTFLISILYLSYMRFLSPVFTFSLLWLSRIWNFVLEILVFCFCALSSNIEHMSHFSHKILVLPKILLKYLG